MAIHLGTAGWWVWVSLELSCSGSSLILSKRHVKPAKKPARPSRIFQLSVNKSGHLKPRYTQSSVRQKVTCPIPAHEKPYSVISGFSLVLLDRNIWQSILLINSYWVRRCSSREKESKTRRVPRRNPCNLVIVVSSEKFGHWYLLYVSSLDQFDGRHHRNSYGAKVKVDWHSR